MSGEGGLVEVLAAHSWSAMLGGCHSPEVGSCRWRAGDVHDEQRAHAEHQAAAVREWLAGALDEVKIPDDTGDEWQHGFGVGCVATMREVRDRLGITGGGR